MSEGNVPKGHPYAPFPFQKPVYLAICLSNQQYLETK